MPPLEIEQRLSPAFPALGNGRCADCGAMLNAASAFYPATQPPLCLRCFRKRRRKLLQGSKGRVPDAFPAGVPLVHFLLVILLLGVLTAVSLSMLRERKQEAGLEVLRFVFLEREHSQVGSLAKELAELRSRRDHGQEAERWAQVIQQAAQSAGVPPGQLPEFEATLESLQRSGDPDAEAGAFIQAMDAWKTNRLPGLSPPGLSEVVP